ncbi:SsgA family sporulation/cell division regulator [Streptomyces sp. NBC_00344]
MSPSVEMSARGHVVTDTPGHWTVVRVAFRYDPASDAGDVTVVFPGGTEWVFARELLEAGLRAPQRSGNVGMWPCGRAQAVLEFHSAHGVAVVQFDKAPLMRFLGRTYRAVPHAVGHGGPQR